MTSRAKKDSRKKTNGHENVLGRVRLRPSAIRAEVRGLRRAFFFFLHACHSSPFLVVDDKGGYSSFGLTG